MKATSIPATKPRNAQDDQGPLPVWFNLSMHEYESIETAALAAHMTLSDYAASTIKRTVNAGGFPTATLVPLPRPSVQNLQFKLDRVTWRKALTQAYELAMPLCEFCRRILLQDLNAGKGCQP